MEGWGEREGEGVESKDKLLTREGAGVREAECDLETSAEAELLPECECRKEVLGVEVFPVLGVEVVLRVGPKAEGEAEKEGEREGEGETLGDFVPLTLRLGEAEVLLLLHGAGLREGRIESDGDRVEELEPDGDLLLLTDALDEIVVVPLLHGVGVLEVRVESEGERVEE